MASNAAAGSPNPATSGVVTGKSQPQTTIEPPGGPFIRHSQPGRRLLYQNNYSFGQTVSTPLVSVPGYYRRLRVTISATGGAGTAVAGTADAPYNVASLVTLTDAFGNPLIVAPGYEAFNLIPRYSGAVGWGATRDVSAYQSFSSISATTGNFQFSSSLPMEFTTAYGVISGANASLLPRLTINLAPASAVYSTLPSTLPTLTVTVSADFYWLPEGANVQPPGLGTTCQWIYQACNPSVSSQGTVSVKVPKLGGYFTTLIFELRDSTQARVDAWPTEPRAYIDGVPLIDSTLNDLYDDMQTQFQNVSRPSGILVFTRKDALSQTDLGLLDTGEKYLSTNPGTQVELQGSPWGTITNSPATLYALVGQVVPSKALIQGLPEV